MMEQAEQFLSTLNWESVFVGVCVFIVSIAISFAAIALVMVKVPPEYFSIHHRRTFLSGRHWLIRYSAVILKNILGLVLIVLGILLSLPGVPGQGILTILLGLIMLDIPGKRPLEAKIIQQPKVLAAINSLRARYHKAPLIMD